MHCNDWYSFVKLLHEAGGGTTYNETEFWGIDLPIMMSHCYTIPEKINYIRGLKMYRTTTLSKELKDYCEKLNAPDKGFYLIPNAAHSPLWENPTISNDAMKEILEKTFH